MKREKTIAVLEIGSDESAPTGAVDFSAIEAYASIEAGLEALYEDYVSVAGDAEFCKQLTSAELVIDAYQWEYVVKRWRWCAGHRITFTYRGRLVLVDLMV